jgi:hypothetical protein
MNILNKNISIKNISIFGSVSKSMLALDESIVDIKEH